MKSYAGMVTSDWSECLSPCGPFDMITFHHPHLADDINGIFKAYTGNAMTLARAVDRIKGLLPAALSREKLDVYLQESFEIYADVAAFMAWCRHNDILFMINSTGAIGYFQRAFALGLLETPDVLAASPMVRFEAETSDPGIILPVREISDKPRHSAAIAQRFQIPHARIVVIGDSGGDGPHFEWGARIGATLIASLAKPSLLGYCRSRKIAIQHHWNPDRARVDPGVDPPGHRMDLNDLLYKVRNIFGR